MDGRHYVGIFVQKSQKVFQAIEQTFATAQNRLCYRIFELFQFSINVLQDELDYTADRNNQTSKSQSPEMETDSSVH